VEKNRENTVIPRDSFRNRFKIMKITLLINFKDKIFDMKKWFLISSVFFCAIAFAQKNKTSMMSCCMPDAPQSFARFASDRSFVMSHETPLPFHYTSENGKDIHFKASDGTEAHGWEIKANKKTNDYLFVIHEWWGLNDYIKKQSEQLWKDLDINVIALDLYDNKVASTPQDAGKYMQSVTKERAEAIINGAVRYAGKDARIFTIGWCFGGGWSLQTSLLAGKQAAGCIMFYGMPEKDIDRLKKMPADVLGIFANKDQWITPTVVDEFAATMKKADKKLFLHQYDTDHGFANPSNPHFAREATEDAYKYVLEFLKARI
jgi:carboxymethylenebutenolidase